VWWKNDKYFIANFLLNPKAKEFRNRPTFSKVLKEKYCWSFLTHSVDLSGESKNPIGFLPISEKWLKV